MRNILLKLAFLNTLQRKKSKTAPAIEEVPIIIPIIVSEKPASVSTMGVIYDNRPSKTHQNIIINDKAWIGLPANPYLLACLEKWRKVDT